MTRTIRARMGLVIGAGLLAAMAGAHAQAQDGSRPEQGNAPQGQSDAQRAQAELDRTPEDCVLLNRVERNVAANDRQVVFFMKGGKNYLNILDTSCQALKAGDYRFVFQYRAASPKMSRVCDTDGFTVERQTSRIGCALGQFIPITAEEAAALTAKPAAASAASSSGNGQGSSAASGENKN
ncbi:MAG TPA: hypothetical protein VLI71_06045 [Gammaproteobacteria bacterium]|nr:hypothetical protein [Gammaproteobacteria bacterium]